VWTLFVEVQQEINFEITLNLNPFSDPRTKSLHNPLSRKFRAPLLQGYRLIIHVFYSLLYAYSTCREGNKIIIYIYIYICVCVCVCVSVWGHAEAQFVEALCYKPEFSIGLMLLSALWPSVVSASNRNDYQGSSWG
jgi:hypothetical protein